MIKQQTIFIRFAHRSLVALICAGFTMQALATSALAQPPTDPASDNPPLPKGAQLPGKPSPLLNQWKEEITIEEWKQGRRIKGDYIQGLRAGELSGSKKNAVVEGIRLRVLAMSLSDDSLRHKDVNETRDGLRKDLLRDFKNYAGSQQINARQRRLFREMILDETIKHAQTLLKNQLWVRHQAIALLSELNITEEDRRNNIPPEPYLGVMPVLRSVVVDPDQPDGIKIAAVRGLERLMTSPQSKISRNDRLLISEEMAAQLKDKSHHFGYQLALIWALQGSQIDVDRAGKPFIVQTLAEVMGDESRDPRVRTLAANSLGRVPIANGVNLSLLAYQTAVLTQQMTELYNSNPKQPFWTNCFLNLYAAFQPVNSQEKEQQVGINNRAQGPGFANHQDIVKNAYGKVVPVIAFAIDNKGTVIPNDKSAPLIDWLKDNDPGQYTIAPGLPPLSVATPPATSVSGR